MELADVAEAMRQTGRSRREVEAPHARKGYTVYGSKLPVARGDDGRLGQGLEVVALPQLFDTLLGMLCLDALQGNGDRLRWRPWQG